MVDGVSSGGIIPSMGDNTKLEKPKKSEIDTKIEETVKQAISPEHPDIPEKINPEEVKITNITTPDDTKDPNVAPTETKSELIELKEVVLSASNSVFPNQQVALKSSQADPIQTTHRPISEDFAKQLGAALTNALDTKSVIGAHYVEKLQEGKPERLGLCRGLEALVQAEKVIKQNTVNEDTLDNDDVPKLRVTLDVPNAVADTKNGLDYLKSLPKIRTTVLHDGGKVKGHLSAAADTFRTILELGYKGELEVLYEPEAAGDLKNYFPMFPDGGKLDEASIKYVVNADANKDPQVEIIPLTIIAGFDGVEGLSVNNDRAKYEEAFGTSNSRAVIGLNPPNWPAGCAVQRKAVLSDVDWESLVEFEKDRDPSAVVVEYLKFEADAPLELPKDKEVLSIRDDDTLSRGEKEKKITKLLDETWPAPLTREQLEDKKNIRSMQEKALTLEILKKVVTDETELMPVYGLHSLSSGISQVEVINRISAAGDEVAEQKKKSVTILVIGANSVALESKPQYPHTIVKEGSKTNDILDEFDSMNQSPKASVVFLQSLPKDAFGVVVRSATLPFFLEGSGSLSYTSSGVPYLCLADNTSIPENDQKNSALAEAFRENVKLFTGLQKVDETPEKVDQTPEKVDENPVKVDENPEEPKSLPLGVK